MKRYVLIGDLHAYDLWPAPWRLLGKRFLGQVNLWAGRHKQFDLSLLPGILKCARSFKPQGAWFSGDLTTTSLESEFRFMQQALADFVAEVPSLAVPGNHDRYTRAAARDRRMERFMPGLLPERDPLFRRISDRWHLLALESGRPRAFSSAGWIGDRQLQEMKKHLSTLTAGDGLVVLCHYPADIPLDIPDHPGHMLEDRRALLDCLAACPVRTIYLHGHLHQPWIHRSSDARLKHVTFINAGAPTCVKRKRVPIVPGQWLELGRAGNKEGMDSRCINGPVSGGAGQGIWTLDLPDDPKAVLVASHVFPPGDQAIADPSDFPMQRFKLA